MNMISSWLRRRALGQYRRKLPKALAKDYGKSEYYLPAQVNATLDRQSLNPKYSAFALSMFCSYETYAAYQSEGSLDIDYAEARLIVGRILFNDASDFKQADLSTSPSVAAGPNNSVDGVGISGDGGGDGGGGDG